MTSTDLATRIGEAQPAESRTANDILQSMAPEFAKALPRHIPIEHFLRLALTELRTNPALGNCTQASLLGALMTAARLGLDVGGPIGEFYLTPRRVKGRETCVPIVGYRGLLKLARNAGVGEVGARVIREGDTYREGANSERGLYFEWEPLDLDSDRPVVGAIAVARLSSGGTQHVHLTRAQIESRRDRGAAGNSGPWRTDYEAMVRKTVLRELSKTLPMSTAVAEAVARDEQVQSWSPGQDPARLPDTDAAQVIDGEEVTEADPWDEGVPVAPAGGEA